MSFGLNEKSLFFQRGLYLKIRFEVFLTFFVIRWDRILYKNKEINWGDNNLFYHLMPEWSLLYGIGIAILQLIMKEIAQ